jgi:hypothetical protein
MMLLSVTFRTESKAVRKNGLAAAGIWLDVVHVKSVFQHISAALTFATTGYDFVPCLLRGKEATWIIHHVCQVSNRLPECKRTMRRHTSVNVPTTFLSLHTKVVNKPGGCCTWKNSMASCHRPARPSV